MYQRRDIFALTSKRNTGEIEPFNLFENFFPEKDESSRTESFPFANEFSEVLLDKTPKSIKKPFQDNFNLKDIPL